MYSAVSPDFRQASPIPILYLGTGAIRPALGILGFSQPRLDYNRPTALAAQFGWLARGQSERAHI